VGQAKVCGREASHPAAARSSAAAWSTTRRSQAPPPGRPLRSPS